MTSESQRSNVVVTNAPGGVIITQEVMYAELRATHDAVVVLGAKVDKINDHESRLRTVERQQLRWSGAAAALGMLAGAGAGALAARLIGGG